MKNNNNDSRILNKFASSILKGMKSLDSDISQLIDKHFWSLTEDTSEYTDNLWLACDKDNELVLFKHKPFRDNWYGFWSEREDGISYNCNDEITVREHKANRFIIPRNDINLSWEDEPIKVKLVKV